MGSPPLGPGFALILGLAIQVICIRLPGTSGSTHAKPADRAEEECRSQLWHLSHCLHYFLSRPLPHPPPRSPMSPSHSWIVKERKHLVWVQLLGPVSGALIGRGGWRSCNLEINQRFSHSALPPAILSSPE